MRIEHLNKSFQGNVIFKDFFIDFIDEEINCIVGRSGVGKTTLLNILAGLDNNYKGDVLGNKVDEISYIFQEDRLIPYLTVKENIELFVYNYYNHDEATEKIKSVFKLLHIENILNMYPMKLSGGMRQRVNIARALIKPSRFILMDEPFKSLDYKTKYSIMKETKYIFSEGKKTVIFVTHDVDEAIYMGKRIIVLGDNPIKIKEIFEEELEDKKSNIIDML
ncbi:ABC transporter ATP-binding protein [Clostridium sp. MSJ-8]|uniref:ABC transporter ATP-binding protein n=1 Tax=Clostridium sp. MSJ-8 TaxID=2841510 RepID=UPI001C0F10FD|nr:ABC transporter ATP-binding protein [Clostridium sp. MSJ-8]MBU5486955.1 ABC transporter ATP-binding protein [Clostridium sp. MSJ-8]